QGTSRTDYRTGFAASRLGEIAVQSIHRDIFVEREGNDRHRYTLGEESQGPSSVRYDALKAGKECRRRQQNGSATPLAIARGDSGDTVQLGDWGNWNSAQAFLSKLENSL